MNHHSKKAKHSWTFNKADILMNDTTHMNHINSPLPHLIELEKDVSKLKSISNDFLKHLRLRFLKN